MIKTLENTESPEEATFEGYPIIKRNVNHGTIVLFTEPLTGVVIDSGESEHQVGRTSVKWKEKYFEVYNEPVRLQND